MEALTTIATIIFFACFSVMAVSPVGALVFAYVAKPSDDPDKNAIS